MATRTGDTNLIKGAATAYKNYDNVSGMYTGLDKIIKKGSEISKDAFKKKEEKLAADLLKKEVEDKKQEIKKDSIDKSWDEAVGTTLENSGSFKTQKDYDFTFNKLNNEIKNNFIEAQGPPVDQKKLAEATTALNNEKAYIDDVVAFRNQLSEMDLSKAMQNTGSAGGNDGRQKSILTAFLNEEYEVSEKDGERYYTMIDSNNETHTLTMAQVEDMYIPQATESVNNYYNVFDTYAGKDNLVEGTVRRKVENSVPSDVKGLRAFVSDDNFDGENFRSVLDNDKNLKQEVMQAFEDPTQNPNVMFDSDGNGTIDEAEFERMKDAIIDPYNPIWASGEDGKTDMKKWQSFTSTIVVDKLTNGIMNTKPKKAKSNQEYYDLTTEE